MDGYLPESIVRNMFNFDLVAIELTNELKKQGEQVNVTSKSCRVRWAHIHMQVRTSLE